MNTNSNSYTIIYASVMVVIVAFLLAFVSSSLRATQNKNVELDTKKQILAALNIKNVEDADAEYNKYIKGDMLMNEDGTLTENTGAFATAYEKEAKENPRLRCRYLGRYLGVCGPEQRQGYRLRRLLLSCQRNPGSGCGNRNPSVPGRISGQEDTGER